MSGTKDENNRPENTIHKSLELLYDYAKFHIGIYITLTGSYLAAASAKIGNDRLFEISEANAILAVMCFMAAGLSGGVIVSSITQCSGGTSYEFLESRIGPWEVERP